MGMFLDLYLPQIISLVISLILGKIIINQADIKNFWAFLIPIVLSTIIALVGSGLVNDPLGRGIYFFLAMFVGGIVFIINAIILGTYIKFFKKF